MLWPSLFFSLYGGVNKWSDTFIWTRWKSGGWQVTDPVKLLAPDPKVQSQWHCGKAGASLGALSTPLRSSSSNEERSRWKSSRPRPLRDWADVVGSLQELPLAFLSQPQCPWSCRLCSSLDLNGRLGLRFPALQLAQVRKAWREQCCTLHQQFSGGLGRMERRQGELVLWPGEFCCRLYQLPSYRNWVPAGQQDPYSLQGPV